MDEHWKLAMFQTQLDDQRVMCGLCPHHCKLKEGQIGICKVRQVNDGKLYLKYYGMIANGGQIDPIEKKPLYHFYPGSRVLSFGGVSCNFNCDHCQNYSLSQDFEEYSMVSITCEQILAMAKKGNCQGIAWTYNEPTIYFETYYDWSKVIREHGLYVVWVSNSYIAEEPLKKLSEVVSAINFDVKAFTESFYQQYVGAHLAPVLNACILAKKRNIHLELTYLVIPTLNDSSTEIQAYLNWVAKNLGKDTPLHFSRFYPQNRLSHLPPTPIPIIYQIVEMAYAMGFQYVYAGNIHPNPYNSTTCPSCKKMVIQRDGFSVRSVFVQNGKCQLCMEPLAILGK